MSTSALDLYSLLPSLHRLRDIERHEVLRALLGILQEQANLIRDNIDDLYDDFFIETCAEWVVPYIGELVANNPLYEVTRTRRADVARTLEYRHGKGTQRVLEQLARDVTGWSAHVVPFFELLEWTQNVNHIRLVAASPNPRETLRQGPYSFERVGTADIRNHEVLDRFDGPFDSIAHSVDVRPPEQATGWHNVNNAGFFLWRLQSHRMTAVDARPVDDVAGEFRYHFSPIGNPAPLFHLPNLAERRVLTREPDVSAPIRPAAFFLDLDHNAASGKTSYYGLDASLFIRKDNDDVLAPEICCMDLESWQRPAAGRVGVDVTRGRITFATNEEPDENCIVTYSYGFSGEMGGGPYDRLATIVEEDQDTKVVRVPADEQTLAAAVLEALAGPKPRAVVTITNNRTFEENLAIDIGLKSLVIQSDSTHRPALLGDISLTGGSGSNALILSGLLMAGGLRLEGVLSRLEIRHSTLVPGRRLDENGGPLQSHLPSIFAAATNTELSIDITRSIVGAIIAPSESHGITVTDSIIDSASRDGEASFVPALVSGDLAAIPVLSSPQRQMIVAIGNLPGKTVAIDTPPASLADAAEQLQKAIREAAPEVPEHARAYVVATADALVLIGGEGTQVRVTPQEGDPTANELKLDADVARTSLALLGAERGALTVTSVNPQLIVRIDGATPATATLANVPATLDEARDNLRQAIHDAGAGTAFDEAEVVVIDDERLLVIPGAPARSIVLHPAIGDATVWELGLASVCAAIAGDHSGAATGPAVSLEATTVLGRVHVRQIDASNSIFDERVVADRRQTGCLRFCWIAPRSLTPRRYRCQPEEASPVEPAFTSRRYGDPAYAQLSLACRDEIRSGAEDGSEMGTFHFLMQPQRETNLRIRFDEYLPFGLEAALIFVT